KPDLLVKETAHQVFERLTRSAAGGPNDAEDLPRPLPRQATQGQKQSAAQTVKRNRIEDMRRQRPRPLARQLLDSELQVQRQINRPPQLIRLTAPMANAARELRQIRGFGIPGANIVGAEDFHGRNKP